jgi:hypothetical protein
MIEEQEKEFNKELFSEEEKKSFQSSLFAD